MSGRCDLCGGRAAHDDQCWRCWRDMIASLHRGEIGYWSWDVFPPVLRDA